MLLGGSPPAIEVPAGQSDKIFDGYPDESIADRVRHCIATTFQGP